MTRQQAQREPGNECVSRHQQRIQLYGRFPVCLRLRYRPVIAFERENLPNIQRRTTLRVSSKPLIR